MASEDNFVIRIKGQGSHASSSHMGKDPIVIASEIVLALQTIISRNMNPNVPAVISCTEFIRDMKELHFRKNNLLFFLFLMRRAQTNC